MIPKPGSRAAKRPVILFVTAMLNAASDLLRKPHHEDSGQQHCHDRSEYCQCHFVGFLKDAENVIMVSNNVDGKHLAAKYRVCPDYRSGDAKWRKVPHTPASGRVRNDIAFRLVIAVPQKFPR